MKIGRGVSELWGVENRPLPLTWPMAYTTACTTVQAVMCSCDLDLGPFNLGVMSRDAIWVIDPCTKFGTVYP